MTLVACDQVYRLQTKQKQIKLRFNPQIENLINTIAPKFQSRRELQEDDLFTLNINVLKIYPRSIIQLLLSAFFVFIVRYIVRAVTTTPTKI